MLFEEKGLGNYNRGSFKKFKRN